jgi:hypothetical protein
MNIIVNQKSVGVSILLTFLFGPIGMLYSTVIGAIIMFILSIFIGVATFGIGILITWPICVIWGVISTNSYNKALMSNLINNQISN